MTHWRTSNNTSGRLTEGAFHQPSTSRANTTPRDSNIYYLPPSPSAFLSPPPNDDRELRALIFAGLFAGPLLVASIVLFYLAF